MRKAALLLAICGLVGVNPASAGVLKPVSGPGDLDLSGTVYYAVSLGGTADWPVAGKWFEGDDDGDAAPVGYSYDAPQKYNVNWGYGSITDPGLRAAYDSMRYRSPGPVEVTLQHLIPGEQVNVQLLLSEGYRTGGGREFDVNIQGNTEFAAVDAVALWGFKQPGLGEATATVAPDGTLTVQLMQSSGASDPNPVLDGIIVSSPALKRVASAADLDLNRVRYAINVGGDDSPVVGGVTFRSDELESIPGYTISVPNTRATNWGAPVVTPNELGEVYDDIRYSADGVTQTFANLRPDTPVKVQVLLSEGWWPTPGNRPLDLWVDGQKRFDDLEPVALWGQNQPGVVEMWAHVGSGGVLQLGYTADGGTDSNAIVNGVIVSEIPGYRAVPVSVTASAEYSAAFPATAVVDGSWSETESGGVFDFWLLPDGQTGYLEFDFGTNWNLQFVEIHNTDNRQYGDRGTIAYHIDIAPDPSFAISETIASGTLPTYDQGWYMRPLSTDKLWRYARFYVDDFGGSLDLAGGGLAEIAFYGVPEPSSIALLALGGLGMLLCCRRK